MYHYLGAILPGVVDAVYASKQDRNIGSGENNGTSLDPSTLSIINH